METVPQRLSALCDLMRREHLGAFIITSSDPHGSEILPDYWQCRRWLSGFNGSAGTLVVTVHGTALWTDSRYYIAAAEQLAGTGIELMKEGLPNTPTLVQWISTQLAYNDATEVGIDGSSNSYQTVEMIRQDLRKHGGFTLRTNFDPLTYLWKNRPALPSNKIMVYPEEMAGETVASKLLRIRRALRTLHADGMLVTALDEIAWLLNLRGNDVACNPVFISYLLISSTKTTVFVDTGKLTTEVNAHLQQYGIEIRPYEEVFSGLADYPEYNILIDAPHTAFNLVKKIKAPEIVYEPSPVAILKAIKNEKEISNIRNAMLKDGIAMVKFLHWLGPAVEAGKETELTISQKLNDLRTRQPLYKDNSFPTISAYRQHGAIVHYEPTEATDTPLKPESFLLMDSGAQYLDGTTDITRTIPLGKLTDEERHVYTLVLKGNIQLSMLQFPEGATGTQIDAVARSAMWSEGMNYLHGTGHGVGMYLNVHEGPHQIRMNYNATPLKAGMVVTNEPGLYLPGRFGVRIENTMLIKHGCETEFGRFLQMEPLTLCPIDTTPIDFSMLTPEEKQWLNAYHATVCKQLSPFLQEAEQQWLAKATKPI